MNATPNVLQLQQAAAARVRQMEEHSRRLVREHPVNVYRGVTLTPPPPRPQPPQPPPQERPCEPICPSQTPPASPVCEQPAPCSDQGLLSLLGGDKERLLLLLLAVVLLKNGASVHLILALLYIAL